MNKLIKLAVCFTVATAAFLTAEAQNADAQIIRTGCCGIQTVHYHPVVRTNYQPAVRVRVVVGSQPYYPRPYYSTWQYQPRYGYYPPRYGYNPYPYRNRWGSGYRGAWRW